MVPKMPRRVSDPIDADPFFDAKSQFAKEFVDECSADANAAAG